MDLEQIKREHAKPIAALDKLILNFHTVHNIRFWYDCLANFPPTDNIHEDILKMDAYVTSIVIGYGRLFGAGTGSRQLNLAQVPEHLLKIHELFLSLRHERYAHHGKHATMHASIHLVAKDTSILVQPQISYWTVLGAPKEWAPLFEWLDALMYEQLHQAVDKLSTRTGVRWEVESGPAPRWVGKDEPE
ncbi:MAG: hypothetical protein ABWZ25_08895 [Chitinophagaceae bacterium]